MSEMMRSLHHSVVRTNEATHQLLKNIEERKKSMSLSTIVPTTLSSSSSSSSSLSSPSLSPSLPSSSSSSCSSLQHTTHTKHTTHTTHTAAIQPLEFLKSKSKIKIHPWGDRISIEKNSVENKIDVNIDKEGEALFHADFLGSAIDNIIEKEKENVKGLEVNHLEVEQEEKEERGHGQGYLQGLEKMQGQGEERGQEEVEERKQRRGWGQGQGMMNENEHEQWQLSNAHSYAPCTPDDIAHTILPSAPDDIGLVSDLQDAVGHLRVAFESNICLSKWFIDFKMH